MKLKTRKKIGKILVYFMIIIFILGLIPTLFR